MRTPFIFPFLLLSLLAQAQTEYEQVKAEIKTNLKWFAEGAYRYIDYPDLNIDSIAKVTNKKLCALLKMEEARNLNLNEFPELHRGASTEDSLHISIYYFSYVPGSTGYEDIHSAIQWQNKDRKLLSYPISNRIEGTIQGIVKLPANGLYLAYSMDYFTGIAHALKFQGDYVILDYPLFAKSPRIAGKALQMSFKEQNQELKIECWEGHQIEESTFHRMNIEDPSTSKILARIKQALEDRCSVRLKFNGRKFIE